MNDPNKPNQTPQERERQQREQIQREQQQRQKQQSEKPGDHRRQPQPPPQNDE